MRSRRVFRQAHHLRAQDGPTLSIALNELTGLVFHAQSSVGSIRPLVVPMDFIRVPLTALAGWLIYGERVDMLAVAGTALILGANVMNLRRAPAAVRERVA